MKQYKRPGQVNRIVLAVWTIVAVLSPAAPATAQAQAQRLIIEYVAPAHAGHKLIYDLLKQNRTLELVQASSPRFAGRGR